MYIGSTKCVLFDFFFLPTFLFVLDKQEDMYVLELPPCSNWNRIQILQEMEI